MTGAWRIAVRNLARNRRRNLVTASAIAIGYAGLVVLGGYANRVEAFLRTTSVYLDHRGHLGVYARGGLERAESKPSSYALDAAKAARIEAALRADPRVEFTGRYLTGGGLAGNGCGTAPYRAFGVDMEAERRIASHPEVLRWAPELARPRSGRALAEVDPALSPVTLGVQLARALAKEQPGTGAAPPAGDVAPLDCAAPDLKAHLRAEPIVQLAARTHDGSFGATDAWVVGIYLAGTSEADKTAVTAPLEVLQRVYDTDRVSYVAAFLRDPRQAAAVARDVEARLAEGGLDVAIYRFDDAKVNPYYVGTVGFIGALVSFIGLVVASVVALSVLNAMTLAILERTRELGTFRALGFMRRQVLGLFLREAAALSAIALAAGLALGLAVSAGVNASGIQFEPPGVGGKIPLRLVPSAPLVRGGAILLAALALAAVVALVLVLTRGDGGDGDGGAQRAASTTSAGGGAQKSATRVIAQVNLKPPRGATRPGALGVVQLALVDGKQSLTAIVQGLAITKGSSWGIWAEGGPDGRRWLGPFSQGDRQGRIYAQGRLEPDMDILKYRRLVVTRDAAKTPPETQGKVFLAGAIAPPRQQGG